jgi:EAL and modified HD-GYP domain-containing signal transduction protein
VQVLAEKVETKEAHKYCLALGCDLFQGFFYQEPELLRQRRIELTAGSMLQVISALQNSQLQFDELEPLIAHDLPLSLRLLRYINSAFFSLRHEVTSVRQALVLLGMENVRRWATLTVMGSIEGKTPELTSTALIRARFCELAGVASGMDGPGLFTIGMFSLIDAMLDLSLEEVTEELPFPNEMRVALLRHAGPMGRVLDAATSLEGGYFGDAKLLVPNAGELYVESLLWAQRASGALFDSIVA